MMLPYVLHINVCCLNMISELLYKKSLMLRLLNVWKSCRVILNCKQHYLQKYSFKNFQKCYQQTNRLVRLYTIFSFIWLRYHEYSSTFALGGVWIVLRIALYIAVRYCTAFSRGALTTLLPTVISQTETCDLRLFNLSISFETSHWLVCPFHMKIQENLIFLCRRCSYKKS